MAFIEDPDKYFGSDQVPDDFKLLDPSKMKDTQIKDILRFWYSKQKDGGVGLKFYQDKKLNGKKRSRDDSCSDADSDAASDADSDAKTPSRRRTRLSRRRNKGKGSNADSEADGDSDSDATTASRPKTRQSQRKSKGKGKGKGKMVEKSEERWTEHIFPDSRRRKRRDITASENEESGEEFDFASVDQMESSEQEDIRLPRQPKAGPSTRPDAMTPYPRSKGDGKGTMVPLSKQRNKGLEIPLKKLRAAQNTQEPPKKKARFAIDILADPSPVGKFCL